LNYYAKMVCNLASKFYCQLIDMRKSFRDYNIKNHPQNEEKGILTIDRIPTTDAGNKLIAEKMMETLLMNND